MSFRETRNLNDLVYKMLGNQTPSINTGVGGWVREGMDEEGLRGRTTPTVFLVLCHRPTKIKRLIHLKIVIRIICFVHVFTLICYSQMHSSFS